MEETEAQRGKVSVATFTEMGSGFAGVQVSFSLHPPFTEKLAPPTITTSTLAPLELRDSVTLSCQSPSNDATFQWYTGKEPVVGSGQLELSLDQQRLTIHQVTRNDSGPYHYEVKNPAITRLSEPLLLCVTCECPSHTPCLL